MTRYTYTSEPYSEGYAEPQFDSQFQNMERRFKKRVRNGTIYEFYGPRVDIMESIEGFHAALVEGGSILKTTRSKLRAAFWVLKYGNGHVTQRSAQAD